jgi:hypothetical protein
MADPRFIEGTLSTTIPAAQPPRVPFGLSSAIGLVGAIGAVLAGIDGNDPALIVGSIAAIVTMIGRFSQAIVLAKSLAQRALPFVDSMARLGDGG